MEENSIKWIGYEYHHTEKSVDWFWAVGIIVVCTATISIIYNNFLFAIFILLAGMMSMLLAKRPPEIIDYTLTPKGVIINEKLYVYNDLDAFWVDTHIKRDPELLIKTKKNIHQLFVIPITESMVDPHTIRDYLLQVLKEEPMNESLSHRIMRRLGV